MGWGSGGAGRSVVGRPPAPTLPTCRAAQPPMEPPRTPSAAARGHRPTSRPAVVIAAARCDDDDAIEHALTAHEATAGVNGRGC